MPEFQLSARQNLAVHRFNQYCSSKSILLLHGVGSGKTLTSLSMALNVFNWGEVGVEARKIVIVAPSGVYKNFVDDIGKIPNIGRNLREPFGVRKDAIGNLPTDVSGWTMYFNDRPFTIYGYKYKYLSEFAGGSDINTLKKVFLNAVVIFDEAHRLFRVIPTKPTKTLLNILGEEKIIVNSKRFIAMTGTPYNSKISDIFEMIRFIECSENEAAGSCNEVSSFIPENYINLIPGCSLDTTKRIDAMVFGFLQYILNVLPDFLTTDLLKGVANLITYFKKWSVDFAEARLQYGLFGKPGALTQELGELRRKVLASIEETNFKGGANPYLTLGLNKQGLSTMMDNDRIRLVKTQYRKLLLRYHPDKCTKENYNSCLNKTKEIMSAYGILMGAKSDPTNLKDVLKNELSVSEQRIYIDTVFSFLADKKYVDHLYSNIEGFQGMQTKFGEHSLDFFTSVLGDFKTQIPLIMDDPKQYVSNTVKNIGRGPDVTLKLLLDIPIEKEILHLKNQTGGASIVKYLSRDSGPGTVVRLALQKWYNLHVPLNYKKLAANSLKYISLVDNSMKGVQDDFTGKIISSELRYPGLVDGSLDSILKNKPTELGNMTRFRYPMKEVLMLYNKYTPDQLEYLTQIKTSTVGSKWWMSNIGKLTDIRNPGLRCVGNYSPDYDEYTSEFDLETEQYPMYKIIRADRTEAVLPPTLKFDCPKFRRVLQHLFIMKTGKMFSFEGTLINQPHLIVPNFPAQTVPYDENPRLEYPDVVPSISYKSSTHYFLPLVWSCGGVDKNSPGINVFAAFLNQLGLKYIVLHSDSKYLEKEKLRAIKKIYPIYKNRSYLDILASKIFLSTDNESCYDSLKAIIDKNPALKEHPICVLVHPEMTEGIDCKYNPAIFLLDPPNTIGDYEQLCGRVLRTYGGQGYEVRPKKMVYQMACYNSDDIHSLWENRLDYFKTADDRERAGLSLFYTPSGDVKSDLYAALEMNKEYLSYYAPKTIMDFIAMQLGEKKGGKYGDWPTFRKAFWMRLKSWWFIGAPFRESEDEGKFMDAVISEFEKAHDNKINIASCDYLMGRVDLKLAVINERNANAIRMINSYINKYGNFSDDIVRKNTEGKGLTKKDLFKRQQIINGIQNEDKLKYAYKELSQNMLESNSPDLDRITSLQAEEYQIKLLMKEFINMKFPDLVQIEECVKSEEKKEGKGSLRQLPWCDPFISPFNKNRAFVCKPIDAIERINLPGNTTRKAAALAGSVKAFNYSNPDQASIDAIKLLNNDFKSDFKEDTITYKRKSNGSDLFTLLPDPVPLPSPSELAAREANVRKRAEAAAATATNAREARRLARAVVSEASVLPRQTRSKKQTAPNAKVPNARVANAKAAVNKNVVSNISTRKRKEKGGGFKKRTTKKHKLTK